MTKNLQKFMDGAKEEFDKEYPEPPAKNGLIHNYIEVHRDLLKEFYIEAITQAHNQAIDECLKALPKDAGDYFAGEVDNRVDEVLDFTKQNIKKLKVVANK